MGGNGAAAAGPPHAYGFGPYRLEGATRRLLRAGEVVALTPKAFDVLLALIERRDRVVDKTELMRIVWPDSFVEEANLSQTIFVLRKVLGDGPDGRPFIETVPRRGYRFAADVQDVAPAAHADAPSRVRSYVRWTALGLAIGGVIIGVTIWQGRGDRAPDGDRLVGTRVAVLPFENLTNNRADDWLASAFSDSLTAGLADVPTLISVSRDRIVELYRQQGVREAAAVDGAALRRISQTLGVRYYVHGSYQRVGEHIKVVARLVDLEGGTNDAQESVTDDFANLLRLEDDLAKRFAATLAGGRGSAARRAGTSSLEAYQAVVEARTAYAAGRLNDAKLQLEHAVALDARYAQAWALLARTEARLAAPGTYAAGSLRELREAALVHAQRAVELNPSLYDAHTALALAYRETEQAEPWRVEAEKAVALNPRLEEAYALLGDRYAVTPAWGCNRGHDAARSEARYATALRLDPRVSTTWANLIYHLVWAARSDEAIRVSGEALGAMPGTVGLRRARAMALLFDNRLAEAEQEIRDLSAATGGPNLLLQFLRATITLKRGDGATAAKEFTAVVNTMGDTSYELRVALAYFFAGQPDAAVRSIDRAVEKNPACARFAATSPAFAPFHNASPFRERLAAWTRERK